MAVLNAAADGSLYAHPGTGWDALPFGDWVQCGGGPDLHREDARGHDGHGEDGGKFDGGHAVSIRRRLTGTEAISGSTAVMERASSLCRR